MEDIEASSFMYGQAQDSSVSVVQGKFIKNMVEKDESLAMKSKIDLARLPPCYNSLIPLVGCIKRLAITNMLTNTTLSNVRHIEAGITYITSHK